MCGCLVSAQLRCAGDGLDPFAAVVEIDLALSRMRNFFGGCAGGGAADGLAAGVSVHESQALVAPVDVRAFSSGIVVPVGLASTLSPQLLRAVLLHEVAHVARRDLWVGLLSSWRKWFIGGIRWFMRPAVNWPIVANRSATTLRLEISPSRGYSRRRCWRSPSALVFKRRCRQRWEAVVVASQLEKRIRRIMAAPAAKPVCLSRGSLVGVLAVALLMTATILFAQVRVKPLLTVQRLPATRSNASLRCAT